MGTPIISPWFFYFINVVDGIVWLAILALLGGLISGAIVWYCAMDEYGPNSEEYTKEYLKYGKKCLIITIISSLLLVFVPSQQTCIQMLLADNITYERLETVGSSVENIYNDIIELASGLTGKNE